jgi:hypothetical protein
MRSFFSQQGWTLRRCLELPPTLLFDDVDQSRVGLRERVQRSKELSNLSQKAIVKEFHVQIRQLTSMFRD